MRLLRLGGAVVRRAVYAPPAFLCMVDEAPPILDRLLLELHPEARVEVVESDLRWSELEQLAERLAWEDELTWDDFNRSELIELGEHFDLADITIEERP